MFRLNIISTLRSVFAPLSHTHDDKVDKVTGKGLSTNDYTTDEKNKLAGIAAGANKTVVDSALSSSSANPVQNSVINTALGNKVDKVSGKGLSTNDFTGTYKTALDNLNTTIATAVGNLEMIEVVTSLPTSNIKNNKLYLKANSVSGSENKYDIYVRVNNAWEKVDSLDFSISDYIKKDGNTNLLLSNGTTKAQSSFSTSGHTHKNTVKTEITSGSLDTITDTGWYSYNTSDSANIANVPEQVGSMMEVLDDYGNGAYVIQKVYPIRSDRKQVIYYRVKFSTWSAWKEVTENTTYSAVGTTGNPGLMTAADKVKLNGITESADAVSYSQTVASSTSGAYEVGKITINGTATTIYGKDTNTTYSAVGTTGNPGLMTAADKVKLNNITESADAVSYSQTSGSSVSGVYEIGKITINGTATTIYGKDTDTTYSAVGTSGDPGLMTAADKVKLNNVATGATKTSFSYTNGVLTINNE